MRGDRRREPDNAFYVTLSNAAGAAIADAQGAGTTRNDDKETGKSRAGASFRWPGGTLPGLDVVMP